MNYVKDFKGLLRDGQTLLIVPPFTSLASPALGVHVLQACAREAGFQVSVLYANILLAATIGVETYNAFFKHLRVPQFVGERLFAHSAYDLSLLDQGNGKEVNTLELAEILDQVPLEQLEALSDLEIEIFPLEWSTLKQLEATISPWVDAVAKALTQLVFPIIGCTTSFEQSNASIALFKHIKSYRPETVTIIGGANCCAEMAQGIASLDPNNAYIDNIFSGESETTFVNFLRDFSAGTLPPNRIINGEPCRELDALPTPDFGEYFEQLDYYLSDAQKLCDTVGIAYETSRGCWWGQKHQCIFCGVNRDGIEFRKKSPERILGDFHRFAEVYPTRKMFLVDNLVPYAYFKTLLPRLAEQSSDWELACSLRSHLSLRDVLTLKRAGISVIGAGIESLSSALLKLMNKGALARQNINTLRYTRSAGLYLQWHLLWGFPGESLDMYTQMLDLIPLIYHLQPPVKMLHLLITSFSRYFESPEAYGLRNVRPLADYAAAFPPYADIAKLAAHFVADYECASHQNLDVIAVLRQHITAWQKRWTANDTHPVALQVIEFGDTYILIDTRELPGTQTAQVLNRTQASVALAARPYVETEEIAWALEQKIGVQLDGWYVPLATAKPELLQAFEDEFRANDAQKLQG